MMLHLKSSKKTAYTESDIDFGEKMKKEKNKLFKIIHILKNIIVVENERGDILGLEYT